jgi:hypothetical protein
MADTERKENTKAIDKQPIIKEDTSQDDEIMSTGIIKPASPGTTIGLSDLIPPKRNVNREDVEQAKAKLIAAKAKEKEDEGK